MENKEFTLAFDIYEGKDGNWSTIMEGLVERPNLKKMKLIK